MPTPVLFSARLTDTFRRFFASHAAGGLVLMLCTVVSLMLANSAWGPAYAGLWHHAIAGMPLSHWINDGLMAVFFLLIGLELERELYVGELSDWRNAVLPAVAALGGVLTPAAIHFAFNAGTPGQPGIGIPMATDIAFALGVLALLGKRVPPALKIFLAALAVTDDLLAILVIAVFYTSQIAWPYLALAAGVYALLVLLNRLWRVQSLWPYLLGGALLWYCMLQSGVHATVAGVLLAFAIPFSPRDADTASPSHRLERILHRPVAFGVLPLFALANTGLLLDDGWIGALASANALGIIAGLDIGKPLGIFLFSWLAVRTGACRLPAGVAWPHMAGAGMLGGIGFTMSIFIAGLAFAGAPAQVEASKMAILLASLVAACLGLLWLRLVAPPYGADV